MQQLTGRSSRVSKVTSSSSSFWSPVCMSMVIPELPSIVAEKGNYELNMKHDDFQVCILCTQIM